MITVSRVRQDEIPLAKELLSLTWSDTYGAFLPQNVIEEVTATWHHADRLRAEAQRPDEYFGVAKAEDGRIVGLITMHVRESDGIGIISRLYVHPEFQRQGIGAALLDAAVRAFPAVRRLRLEVEEQNAKGRAFYAKQGFNQIGAKREDISGIIVETLVLEKDI